MCLPPVREAGLRDIWTASAAFDRFRGTAGMPEPCRSGTQRETDWGLPLPSPGARRRRRPPRPRLRALARPAPLAYRRY